MSAIDPALTDEPELAPRQCARCREMFPGDPDLHPTAQTAWWACPACREVLFGR